MISIITIVYNDKIGVEMTIKSVLEQDFTNIEYIIIDGGSNDGTVDIIESYQSTFKEKNIVFKYISEKDNGIYDAMNKGISFANGEWTIFMNAGDRFLTSKTISSVFNETDYLKYGIIYGDALFVDNGHKYVYYAHDISVIVKKMPFCHQASFIRKSLLETDPYSVEYSIVSDYHFFLKLYLRGIKFFKIQKTLAIHDMSGVSNTNVIRGHKEKIRVKKELGVIESRVNLFIENMFFFLKYPVKKLLGNWAVGLIRRFKNKVSHTL